MRALLAVVLLVACSASSVTKTEPGVGERATFLLANPSGLIALDASCRPLGKIADLPEQAAPAYPVLHPDGKQLAFGLTLLPNAKTGFGSDIYAVDLAGGAIRPLVQHEAENVFYASPRYDPTGTVLYFHRRAAVIQNGQYKGNDDSIERLDLRTGTRTRVLTGAADPAISPDGRTLTFVRVVDGQVTGLWTANADGTGARPLLRTKDTFWYLQAPRFSPSGTTVAFSAAGHSVSRGGPERGVAGGSPPAMSRLAHLGVPSELFLAPIDGSGVRSIGQTGDDVVPAWSPDGARIAYVGTGGFFIVTVATQQTETCAQGQDFFFGDLLWLR